jgi:hypothetical protein
MVIRRERPEAQLLASLSIGNQMIERKWVATEIQKRKM